MPFGALQPMKRKSDTPEYDAESSDWTTSPGYTEIVNSPLQTPVSGKAGKGRGSRISKSNRAGPQTPVSNVGQYRSSKLLYMVVFTVQGGWLDVVMASHDV